MSDGVYYVDTDQLNRLCAEQQVQIKYLKEDKARLLKDLVELAQENGRLAATLRDQVVKTETAMTRAIHAEQALALVKRDLPNYYSEVEAQTGVNREV